MIQLGRKFLVVSDFPTFSISRKYSIPVVNDDKRKYFPLKGTNHEYQFDTRLRLRVNLTLDFFYVFSIEDAKQKAEHDKMVKLAEQKKASVRKTVKGMRDQFRKLIDKNNQLPSHLRLDR